MSDEDTSLQRTGGQLAVRWHSRRAVVALHDQPFDPACVSSMTSSASNRQACRLESRYVEDVAKEILRRSGSVVPQAGCHDKAATVSGCRSAGWFGEGRPAR